MFWNFTCGVYIETFSHTFNDQLQKDNKMQVYYNKKVFSITTYECDTSEIRVLRIRYEWDTSTTSEIQMRYECNTNMGMRKALLMDIFRWTVKIYDFGEIIDEELTLLYSIFL